MNTNKTMSKAISQNKTLIQKSFFLPNSIFLDCIFKKDRNNLICQKAVSHLKLNKSKAFVSNSRRPSRITNTYRMTTTAVNYQTGQALLVSFPLIPPFN